MLLLSAFALSGVNFDHFIKARYKYEARVLAFLMMLGLAYTSAMFIINIIEAV